MTCLEKKSKNRCICALLVCLFVLMFSGCSDESTYASVNDDIIEQLADDDYAGGSFLSAETYLNWCNQVKWYAVPVILISILIGIGMMVIFRHVKKIFKMGLFGFVIGIPVLVILVVYAMCFLYGKFF